MKPGTKKLIQQALTVWVAANAIVFLLLAYFKGFSNTPRAIVFIDFWGRLTVYSLWFMMYEFYLNFINSKEQAV